VPRLFFDDETGWWSIPLLGEVGVLRWLAGPERGRDNPPALPRRPPGGPDVPEPPPEPPPPEQLPGDFEQSGEYVTEEQAELWFAIAGDYLRGELEPLGEGEFDASAYHAPNTCTVPARHPPPGTLIGFPGQGSHSWTDPPNNWQSDNAVDVWLFPGSPIFACERGVVSRTYGWGLMDSNPASRFGGWRCHVEHPSGMVSFYTHLQRLHGRRGREVRRGALLGWSGFAACVPHLHFAVSLPFDPRRWAGATFDRNAPPRPPEPPAQPPDEPRRPLRTPDAAWHNLLSAIGPDRVRQRERVRRARRALRDSVS
jgi:murein DD-endopeptidase MepM/ murein hydrolase activator NlpD